jgi:hypothetical protein
VIRLSVCGGVSDLYILVYRNRASILVSTFQFFLLHSDRLWFFLTSHLVYNLDVRDRCTSALSFPFAEV